MTSLAQYCLSPTQRKSYNYLKLLLVYVNVHIGMIIAVNTQWLFMIYSLFWENGPHSACTNSERLNSHYFSRYCLGNAVCWYISVKTTHLLFRLFRKFGLHGFLRMQLWYEQGRKQLNPSNKSPYHIWERIIEEVAAFNYYEASIEKRKTSIF